MQEAIHVLRAVSPLSSTQPQDLAVKEWAQCDEFTNMQWSFSDYLSDTTALYSAVYAHPDKPEGFRMLIFSGDVDGVSSLCEYCVV